LIQAGPIGFSAQLLGISQFIYEKFYLWMAVTEKEIAVATQAWPFDFGYWYAARMSIFGITVMYSVVCPLILPFAVIYFILMYTVDVYNLSSNVFHVPFNSGGEMPITADRSIVIYVCIFQFVMASFFAIQGSKMTEGMAGILYTCWAATLLLHISWALPAVLHAHRHHALVVSRHSVVNDLENGTVNTGFTHPLNRADADKLLHEYVPPIPTTKSEIEARLEEDEPSTNSNSQSSLFPSSTKQPHGGGSKRKLQAEQEKQEKKEQQELSRLAKMKQEK